MLLSSEPDMIHSPPSHRTQYRRTMRHGFIIHSSPDKCNRNLFNAKGEAALHCGKIGNTLKKRPQRVMIVLSCVIEGYSYAAQSMLKYCCGIRGFLSLIFPYCRSAQRHNKHDFFFERITRNVTADNCNALKMRIF